MLLCSFGQIRILRPPKPLGYYATLNSTAELNHVCGQILRIVAILLGHEWLPARGVDLNRCYYSEGQAEGSRAEAETVPDAPHRRQSPRGLALCARPTSPTGVCIATYTQ